MPPHLLARAVAAWRRLMAVPDQIHQINTEIHQMHTEMRSAMSTLTDEVVETLQLLPPVLDRYAELVTRVTQLRAESESHADDVARAQALAQELGPLNDRLAAALGAIQADPAVPEITVPTDPATPETPAPDATTDTVPGDPVTEPAAEDPAGTDQP